MLLVSLNSVFLSVVMLESSVFNRVGDITWRTGLCRGLDTVFGHLGTLICLVRRTDLRRSTGLV